MSDTPQKVPLPQIVPITIKTPLLALDPPVHQEVRCRCTLLGDFKAAFRRPVTILTPARAFSKIILFTCPHPLNMTRCKIGVIVQVVKSSVRAVRKFFCLEEELGVAVMFASGLAIALVTDFGPFGPFLGLEGCPA
jgi:hypothetical protein